MGQVFTPQEIVREMLDKINFTNSNALTSKIMEPSFGDGAFLTEIVSRIMFYGKKQKLNNNEILKIILNNVFGIEKDKNLYQVAIEHIRNLLSKNGIEYEGEFHNLLNGDTIELHTNYLGAFKYVVGNPPYVRRRNWDNPNLIKSLSFTSSGMCDLYIAFFDIGIQMLNNDGKLCYITPNSYFNSSSAKTMRKYIIENNILTNIKNYGHEQVFDNATTYCCITTIDKTNNKPQIIYEENNNIKTYNYDTFYLADKFFFNICEDFDKISNYKGNNICTVKNGCATLMDKFFINSELSKSSNFVIQIIKASTGKKYFCFYPYDKDGNIIDFGTIQQKEPRTAQFLLENKELLEQRTIDKNAMWYGFGRSQAINDTYKKKYVINSLYKEKTDIHIYACEDACAVYSGLYILTQLNQTELENILISDSFIKYVKALGKYKSGGYYTASSKDIEKFINFSYNKTIC